MEVQLTFLSALTEIICMYYSFKPDHVVSYEVFDNFLLEFQAYNLLEDLLFIPMIIRGRVWMKYSFLYKNSLKKHNFFDKKFQTSAYSLLGSIHFVLCFSNLKTPSKY